MRITGTIRTPTRVSLVVKWLRAQLRSARPGLDPLGLLLGEHGFCKEGAAAGIAWRSFGHAALRCRPKLKRVIKIQAPLHTSLLRVTRDHDAIGNIGSREIYENK